MEKEFRDKVLRFGLITLVICILLEIFVFNYKSFTLLGGKYNQRTIPVSEAQVTGASESNGVYTASGNEIAVKFPVNDYVKTIKFNMASADGGKEQTDVSIAYTESAHRDSDRYSNKKMNIVKSMPETKYATCSFTGETYTITMKIESEANQRYTITGLTINEKIPFKFSFIRVFMIFIIMVLGYVFAKYPGLDGRMNLKKKSQKAVVIFAVVVSALTLTFIAKMYTDDLFKTEEVVTNQINQELVDAFEKGQVSLLDPVPQALLDVDNPYDWTQRTTMGESYKWDHLLYNGKYYSYYGITTVLTLFMPYHKITGKYFSTALATYIYSMIALIFIALIYISVVKNWFKKIPFRMTIMGLFTTLIISGVTLNVVRPKFYELASASGLCFTAIGMFFIINSGIFQKKKIKKSFLFLSALFMGLAVLARVTAVFWCFACVIWILYGLIQNNKQNGKNAIEIIKYVLAAGVPYVVFGLIQMWYNYARFGSVFDFGIQYSLTINDFTQAKSTIELVMVAVVNTLLVIPTINSTFPFIHGNYDSMQLNGYYFVDTPCTMGLIARGLSILSVLYAPKLAKNFDKKEKIKLALTWLIPGIIFPLIMVSMTWENGYSIRYGCDYAWQFMMAGLAVMFYVCGNMKNEQLKKWIYRVFVLCTIWAVISTIAASIAVTPESTLTYYDNEKGMRIYCHLRNLIMFWN